MERVEGFGRFMAAKLPFKPRPGMDEETSMQRATGAQRATHTDEEPNKMKSTTTGGDGGQDGQTGETEASR